jgi:hypothetical protein
MDPTASAKRSLARAAFAEAVKSGEGGGLAGKSAAKWGRRYIGCDLEKGGTLRVELPPA